MPESFEPCSRCGTLLPGSARFCPNCGVGAGGAGLEMPLLRVVGAVGSAIGAMVLGLMGACFLLGGASSLIFSPLAGFRNLGSALITLLLGLACLAGVVRLMRSG